jgi:hypothetical protein
MSQRYTIFPSRDNKTGVLRYAFKDEKADADKASNDRLTFGTSLYSYDNGLFLIIENAADAITVCALLNHIEKNTAAL